MTPPLAPRPLRQIATTVVALALALPLTPSSAHAPSYVGDHRPTRPAAAAPVPHETPAGSSTGTARPAAEERVRIPRAATGRQAIELLGDQLPAAARAHEMSATELRQLLRTDRTARVHRDGRIAFIDPVHTEADHTEAGHTETGSAAATTAQAPLAETFALHSKPGSQRTIYLDFDGADVSDTEWNRDPDYPLTAGWHAGWDPAGDGATFSSAERAEVQSVWARVAEDFAPFDVDVTTEDPGAAAITRNGWSDQVYGTRVLVTGSNQAASDLCNSQCGGVAFLNVFDEPTYHADLQPAWVFPSELGNDTKSVAEAATHEAGHNLALKHDATTTSSYYSGHAGWAPIMGVGYSRPLVQWSRGAYSSANNTEDDLAIIADSGAPVRADEAGATVGTAAAQLPTGPAYITSDADRDVYALGRCSGEVSLAANPAATSPNLDIAIDLLDAAGVSKTHANPTSAASTRDRMTGLAATARTTVDAGTYYLRVDGTGEGSTYEGYGSLGAYTLSVTGCGLVETAVAPDAAGSVHASPGADGRTATLTWQAPASDGGSPVTGYALTRDGAAVTTLGATARSHTFTGLAPGATYSLGVAAVNAVGTGPVTTATVTTPTAPGQPTSVTATRDASAGSATLSWQRPASDGGSPLTGYQARLDAGGWVSLPATASRHTFTGVDASAHQLSVRAVNAAGTGTAAVADLAAVVTTTTQPPTTTSEPPTSTQPPPPSDDPEEPTGVGAPTGLATATDALTGTVRLSWQTPLLGSVGSLLGYDVVHDGETVSRTQPGTRAVTLTGLERGVTHRFGVRALDLLGLGPLAWTQVTLPGAPPAPAKLVTRVGKRLATVRWQAPASYDQALVTGWRVRAVRGGVQVAAATLPASARAWSHRLRGRTRTVLQVTAISADLSGPAATTAPLTPVRRPSAPRIGRARGDGRADG
ncbi:fibronectin type III domain-containing protein, partial [Nocardioides sp. SYSU DS0663]|uniref:fibronectin type III domain-containing protein n=1 Tax=Nocardioides sp. SYSU DS0663 TaxID=3416445 RepID=UPI003F4C2895